MCSVIKHKFASPGSITTSKWESYFGSYDNELCSKHSSRIFKPAATSALFFISQAMDSLEAKWRYQSTNTNGYLATRNIEPLHKAMIPAFFCN
jgi:hypothetical protein